LLKFVEQINPCQLSEQGAEKGLWKCHTVRDGGGGSHVQFNPAVELYRASSAAYDSVDISPEQLTDEAAYLLEIPGNNETQNTRKKDI
jgi:hypothetical protein